MRIRDDAITVITRGYVPTKLYVIDNANLDEIKLNAT
jgi:hypothetical protein